jgi:nicotinamide mononucleotide transporter
MGGCALSFDLASYLTAHWAEIAGSVLGLIQIWLLVRRSVWNFPLAMASVTLLAITLFQAKYYSEAGLQGFFFVVNAIGWFQWRAVEDQSHQVLVSWMPWRQRAIWLVVTALLSLSLGWVMNSFTNAALPFADSAVAGASIAAQLLLNFRKIENWVLWVVIDLASIALYLYRDLYFLFGLYLVFLVMSVIGLRQWKAAGRSAEAA